MSWLNHLIAGHGLAVWTIVVALLANIPCAIVGCYLVLRRTSLMGDAISHSVLPGIVIAFVWSHRLESGPMFAGAIVMGLLAAVLTQSLNTFARVPEDSSMGVVFTSLFALGVFLLSNLARYVDLDPSCVLYGLIEAAPLDDTMNWFGLEVPLPVAPLVAATLLAGVFVTVFWKELKISSFDPALSSAMGINATLMHYLLMAMVAMVTVAAFEAVGSIIVIAMLIVPAATAHLLTDRFGRMMGLAILVAVAASVLGYYGAVWIDTTVAGMIGVTAGGLFASAVLFSPRHGVLGKAWNHLLLALRIVGEDIVALLYRAEELAGLSSRKTPGKLSLGRCVGAVGGGALAWLAAARLLRRGEVQVVGGELTLTPLGRRLAQSLVRSHRLWEAFLIEHFQLPLDHVHAPAERIEHYIGPQLQEILAADLRAPDIDPHGREIPKAE
ncbi:MAG TPA: metal ABC transporter permease [Pirellulales bacterium]|jgi:ABC-type Mn2+/Zn2+ transport system permease subunit|nr:metal ABC transporter permease [Pirellulales bacterium]